MTIHRHFEVFEFEPTQPDYADWMMNFQEIGQLDFSDIPHIVRILNNFMDGFLIACMQTGRFIFPL